MKDNFSDSSAQYRQYRPVYPQALFDYLLPLLREKATAWDCATGNGQIAAALAPYFRKVIATDISAQQLAEAPAQDNISYRVEPAEHNSAADHSFDLITVAQAIHWFDFDAFYKEVRRTMKAGGILAVIGYGPLQAPPGLQQLLNDFYTGTVGPYWDPERHFIDEHYRSIPFPFTELPTPKLSIDVSWNLEQLTGYLGTWSATRHYIRARQQDPVPELAERLETAWTGAEAQHFSFPLLLRVARL